jgi:hypothetical protein
MKNLRSQLLELGFKESAERSKQASEKPKVTKDPNEGIRVSHWFYGAMEALSTKQATAPTTPQTKSLPSSCEPAPETEIAQLMVDNPTMSGATFYNMIKSKGYSIHAPAGLVKPKVSAEPAVESQAGSSAAGVQRAGVRESLKRLATTRRVTREPKGRFLERAAVDDGIGPTRFRCVLISEGLGNFKDAYYYSRDALVGAVPVFEGKKIFADHPSSSEESIRPERSVRDVLGHFEKIGIEESNDGTIKLVGDVVILGDKQYEWARGLLRHAVQYSRNFPDKDFVGLSINASGDAEERELEKVMESAPQSAKVKLVKAKEQGIERVRYVSTITEAVSCDLVTEAGAGGRILSMIESERTSNVKR